MGKKIRFKEEPNQKPYLAAMENLRNGPLGKLAQMVTLSLDREKMRLSDWAYVSANGWIAINPQKEATIKEWEYILAHCLLHLGFGHARVDRQNDIFWQITCDLVVTQFLLDHKIGKPPESMSVPLPFPARDEEQVYEKLQLLYEHK